MPVKIPVIATSIATGEVVRFESVTSAARVGGFDRTCVQACIHGQRKHHNGFIFTTPATLRQTSADTLIHKIANYRNQGYTNKATAAIMGLSASTVRNRVPMARHMKLLKDGL
ncbi:hypothetical protein [Aeromonas phage 3]|nr:hypothetical protein [Aeromonas phage 3]